MQVQSQGYYAIQKESYSTLIINRQNTKPLPKHSAYSALTTLHQGLIKGGREIKGIQKPSEIKRIVDDIFNGYECKMGFLGRFWDNIKQFICIQTERKQLKILRNEMIKHVYEKQFLKMKSELSYTHQELLKIESPVQNQIVSSKTAIPSLSQIESEFKVLEISKLKTHFNVITHLAQYINSFNGGQRMKFHFDISPLESRIYPMCAKMGRKHLKLDQLDQARQAYELMRYLSPERINGYLALINKYLQKNQTDQAYEMAEKLMKIDSKQAEEPLKKIQVQYLCKHDNTQAEKVKERLEKIQQQKKSEYSGIFN